ncbi:MAG: hypothetical protein LAO23_05880 [Acidobacteriia bacterium]|nr:hypothetical protein [Terriglobia bacterium]
MVYFPVAYPYNMKASGVVYLLLTFVLFIHFLRYNNYSTDTVEYVGNVVALHPSDPVAIRDQAYQAVTTEAPAMVVPHILGDDLSTQQADVRRAKHADPYRFAQFLPYFSVKPLYIEALNLVHKAGVGLVRSIAVVSAISFAGLAALIYWWVLKLGGSVWAACLVLLTPEMSTLAQGTGPDGLSVLFLIGGLFSLWYVRPSVGVTLLLSSAWVRPENAIFCILVVVYLAVKGELRAWMAVVLIAISAITPMAINHFGGYGWKALYSHTFKFTEMDPGMFVPTFTASDYLNAFRSGVREALHSSLVAYLFLWVVGLQLVPRMRWPLVLCGIFSAAKFVIYPNFEPRYYGLLYLVTAIGACAAIQSHRGAYEVSRQPAAS